MKFKTELLDHQRKAVDKLKKLKVGALFMEQGTGKTRTALELINIRLNKVVSLLCKRKLKERHYKAYWRRSAQSNNNMRNRNFKHIYKMEFLFVRYCK